MGKTKELNIESFEKIIESIPPDELIKHARMNSPFYFHHKTNGAVFSVRPEPKTELLSPDGKVLMRDGELVEDIEPNTYIGIDYGYRKSYSVPFTVVKEDD